MPNVAGKLQRGVQAVIIARRSALVIVKHYPEGTAYILPGGS